MGQWLAGLLRRGTENLMGDVADFRLQSSRCLRDCDDLHQFFPGGVHDVSAVPLVERGQSRRDVVQGHVAIAEELHKFGQVPLEVKPDMERSFSVRGLVFCVWPIETAIQSGSSLRSVRLRSLLGQVPWTSTVGSCTSRESPPADVR